MLTKSDLEKLAQIRLDDSLFLLEAGRSSSAYYLAGYAVELALKTCIAKDFQAYAIPDKRFVNAIYTHRLDNLLAIANLLPEFNSAARADAVFEANWFIASQWTEESRYEFWDRLPAAALVHAVGDREHGVFQWVKTYW